MILLFVFLTIALSCDILSRIFVVLPLDAISFIHLPVGSIAIAAICLGAWLLGD
ncbi:MAG: hypothetical protein WBB29_08415 [Geitlerinemataceae cyanobacterium]